MKTESELLELYAEAYKDRSIEKIKDLFSPIIIYLTPNKLPQVKIKNQLLLLLTGKFEEQKKQVPLERVSIMLVDNADTGKENIYIDFGDKREYLFSIEVDNGLYEQIQISELGKEKIKTKKVILKKQFEDVPKIKSYSSNLEMSDKFNYLESGMLMILEEDDPNEVIDVILNSNYPYESCIAENFKPKSLINLIKSGFYVMSISKGYNQCVAEAMHHLSRSVLFFDHIYIKKSIKNFLTKYELKENVDFEVIVDKCVEKHGDYWLSKPLVESIKEIHRMNNQDVTFISFGLYRGGRLVAGDFGTKVGRIYSSYSGFYEEDNSGTVQMILTAQYLQKCGYAFWDLGMPVGYKSTVGAKTINLEDFIIIWRKYSTQVIAPNLKFEKYPLPKQNFTEEQLLWELRNAYRYFYIDDLKEYMSDTFHYASQHVFDEITSKESYLEYLKGKLKTIQKSGSPYNELLMEIVVDSQSNRPYLYLKQNNNEALFVAKVKNGKFMRLDLCIPGLYSFIKK